MVQRKKPKQATELEAADNAKVAHRHSSASLSPVGAALNVEGQGEVELADSEDESNDETATSITNLSFEVLDNVFSCFSRPGGSLNQSYYESQQDLLSFCGVSRQFYQVARLHLARSISFATSTKAKQILSLCDSDETFGPRVQSLSLWWPDQGKYATRRSTVLTVADVIDSLFAFPALRTLELVCLPFPRLEEASNAGMLQARLLSTGALSNLRSLTLTNSAFTQRKEEFQTIAILLSLTPSLKHLHITNMPLDIPETLAMPLPTFSLKTLSIRLTSPRALSPATLTWMTGTTAQSKSLEELTVHLSTTITDKNDYNGVVKESLGFNGLEKALARLAPSVRELSLLGLRTGQASSIISSTTSALQSLTLYSSFGLSPETLSDLPLPSNVHTLSFLQAPARYLPFLDQQQQQNQDEGTFHPEIPVSSASFLQEIQPHGRLENLKKVKVPENARFAKRGKWMNNTVVKMCKRRGVEVEEVKMESGTTGLAQMGGQAG